MAWFDRHPHIEDLVTDHYESVYRFAYRLSGVTRTPSLGVSWSITEYSSLRVVYARELTYAVHGLSYYSTVFNAAFMLRF